MNIAGNVVQKGLRSCRHHKDLRTKMAHRFFRVLGGHKLFWSKSIQNLSRDWNIAIVVTIDFNVMLD